MAVADFETKAVDFEIETKVGGQTEDSALTRATTVENHRKPRDYKKEIFEKMVDDVKTAGGQILPRFQETSSQKLGTAELAREMTLGTTKGKMLAIEECTDIKARPSIKQNEAQASIKLNNVRPIIKLNEVRASIEQNKVRASLSHPVATPPHSRPAQESTYMPTQ